MSTTEPLLSACAGGGAGGNDGEEAGKKSRQSSSKGRRVCIDEALSSYAGEFGRWQLRHFVAVSAAWALEALHTMVIIFADREPPTSCAGGGWEWAGGGAAASSSTVAEWGLVCGERYKVGLAQAVFFAGCMIGQCSLCCARRSPRTHGALIRSFHFAVPCVYYLGSFSDARSLLGNDLVLANNGILGSTPGWGI